MRQDGPLWQNLDESLPIVSEAKAVQVEILPSRNDELRLGAVKGSFPEGELYLLLSNWYETDHWYTPAHLEEGELVAVMTGVEGGWDPEEPRPGLLTLGLKTEKGLIQYPLRARRLLSKLRPSARNPYFHDERELWGDCVTTFMRDGQFYEVLPRFARTDKKLVELGLNVMPRAYRYWKQLSYSMELNAEGAAVTVRAMPPQGAPELEGFVLHQPRSEGENAIFLAGEALEQGGRQVTIDLAELPDDGNTYQISGVTEVHDGLMFYVPLSLTEPENHEQAEEYANGKALLERNGKPVYLGVDVLCRASFLQTGKPAGCRQGIEAAHLADALERELLPREKHCAIREVSGEDWKWSFEVPNMTFGPKDEVLVTAQRKGELYRLAAQVLSADPDGSLLQVDFAPLARQIQNSLTVRWDLDLAVRQGDDWYWMRLRSPRLITRRFNGVEQEYMDESFVFGQPLGAAEMGEQTVEGLICHTANGFCQLQIGDRTRRYERQLVCRAENARLRGSTLHLKVRCPNSVPGRWKGFALVHRYKLEADRAVFSFPADSVQLGVDCTWLTAKADLSQFTFTPLYWDIRAVFEGEDGVDYLVPAHMPDRQESPLMSKLRRRSKQLERTIFPGSYRQGADLSVSLYTTADRNFALVCQDYSPYSGILFRMKERLAMLLAQLFKNKLAAMSIFLVYEKYCCMAQDNGFYFFKHCMDNDMEKKMNRSIYFVIDKKQPDYQERLLPYADHVIQFMSLKHMVYILAARLLISSDSKAHAYAWRAKESIILPRITRGKKLVFLQHGVIALKRVEFYSKGTNAVSLFVTSNQREHDIIVDEMAYAPEDVIITGLARWDVLKDKPIDQKHILVMPTWRNWLEEVSDEVFMASDYYRNYMSLLNDPRLAQLLEREDLYLDFYIHPKFREYLSNFSISAGERVRLIPFGSEPLNELMMECRMLITDYSSVCWDVYYQGKPVLFYQFDVDKYNETTGSYIDLETELFGDRVMTAEELLEQIEVYSKTDFRLPEVYAEMRPKMYAYLDHNNSQRTCEEIMKRNW